MTTNDIEKAEILLCCKNGEKLLGITDDNIVLEIPKNKDNGDYSTNIALKNCKKININQLIITNLDNYLSYVKSILLIDQQQIRYIISLTINNKYNKILKSNKYFSDNITYYNNNFNKMLFFNYNKNYCLLKKYNIEREVILV